MDDLFCEQLRLRFSYDPDTGLKVMGKLMNLGQFATEQEAHAVYMDAKRIYHPAFVRPNGG